MRPIQAIRVPLVLLLACTAGCGRALAADLDLDDSDQSVARYVLDQWLEAQGGLAALNAVRNYAGEEVIEINSTPSMTQVRFQETVAGHFRVESSNPASGILVQAYDGSIAWRSHSKWGLGPISKADLPDLQAQAGILSGPAAMRDYSLREFLSPETLAGRPCTVIGMAGKDRPQERWYFDKESHQLLRMNRPLRDGLFSFNVDFSDYRKVGMLTQPFIIRISTGQWSMRIRRSRLLINPPLDESAFVPTMDQLWEITTVDAILKRYAALTGDADGAADQIQSRIIRSSVTSSASGVKSQVILSQRMPDHIRCEMDTSGMGRIVEGYDGQEGWMENDIQGFHWLKPAEIENLVNLAGNYRISHLDARCPLRKFEGGRVVNGQQAIAITLATFGGPQGTFFFDKKTGRLLRMAPPAANDPMRTIVDFSDYRPSAGGEMPFVITVNNAAGQILQTVQSIDNNVPLDDSLFRPTPSGDP